MNYLVHDSKRGKVFETLAEASAYASDYQKATSEFIAVTETKRKATHKYR